jgi:hypothetical protein
VNRLPLLTASSSKTFRACPRLYKHRYVDGVVPRTEDAEARRFGTLLHVGLEAWWRHLQAAGPSVDQALEAALDALPPAPEPDGEGLDPFARVRLEELLRLYDARWFPETAQSYQVLAVEAEYRAPLLNPDTSAPSRTFQRAGKIDVIVRERDTGRTLLVEHKSSSEDISPGSDYWARLVLDGQISHYYAGAEALGHRIDACVYDVIGKPAHRRKLATPEAERKYTQPTKKDPTTRLYANQRDRDETLEEYAERVRVALIAEPDRFVRRAEIVRLEDDLRDAAFDDWQTARAIREAELAKRWPRNPDACKRYGSTCAYFAPCTRAASIDDPLLYRHERPHRELTDESAPTEPATAAE